ncbi:MAG: efflux RND transporter periplasmic adaptor subunit [Gemmataceae bacterium]
MNRHHRSRWHTCRFLVLTGVVLGCNTAVPVVETPPPPVTVSLPVHRDIIDYDEYEGRIAAIPMVEVRARVRGQLISVRFEDGQIVEKDVLLFEIDPRTYKAELDAMEAQKAAAEAAFKLAQSTVNRDEKLLPSGAVSRQEYEISLGKLGVSKAEISKATAGIERAKLDLDFTKIKAPITGKISRALVDEGNLVNAGGADTLLTTITAIDPIFVYFNVDDRALARYLRDRPGQKNKDEKGSQDPLKERKIPVEVGLEGEEGFPNKGLLDFADNKVDPGTGTIQLRGSLPNPKRLLAPGMRARVRIPVSDAHKAVMVVDRAIGTDQSLKYVYVVGEDHVAKRRDVQLGLLKNGMRVIKKGLEPTDQVIVNGIQSVRPEMKVDPKLSEMPGLSVGG